MASLGGFVKQYQVAVDPNKLAAYKIPITEVMMAIKRANLDVGGGSIEMGETEFVVRSQGYIRTLADLGNIVVMSTKEGTPVLVKDLAEVRLGPEMRRGVAEWDGQGETVGGIIVMRFGENALQTIERVKEKLESLKAGLPEGVTIKTAYDRSGLIERAVATLKEKLLEESIVVALVTLLFLAHLPSALVAICTLPVAILLAFVIMHAQGINANIMSLGGIAIAIGAMIDAAIIMIENAHKHLERDRGRKPHWQIILDAASEVGPTLFYSLLVITVSFAPVFTLTEQSGRLFKPLAFTKTYAMAAAALLVDHPGAGAHGLVHPRHNQAEQSNPINRMLIRLYHPVVDWVLQWRKLTLLLALVAMCSIAWPLVENGVGIHAAALRRRSPLHADHLSGPVGDQGQGDPAADRPHHPPISRGGACLRQGRTGRDRNRSCADDDARNHHHAQARKRVAAGTGHALLLRLAWRVGVAQKPFASPLAGRTNPDRRSADRTAQQRHPVPRPDQCLDHADQDPDRHALHRHQNSGRDQSHGQ